MANITKKFVKELMKVIKTTISERKYNFEYADVKVHSEGDSSALVISWGIKDFGFGQFTVILKKDKILIDTERMSLEFVAELFVECKDQLFEKMEVL